MNTSILEKACEKVGGLTALSKAIGISPAYAWQLKKGMRPLKPTHCVAIERATGGTVTRKDLRPNDWQDIWPELSQSLSNQGLGQDAGANSLADKPELAEKGE